MIISDDKTIKNIQDEFQEKFPFLKLEFYTTPHKVGEGSAEKLHIEGDKTIGKIRKIHNSGNLSINGHLKVSTFEQSFYDKYGLNVQVFRRANRIYLQTSTTDSWTLSEQNKKGEESLS